ncbi:MAG: hypothetical protein V3V99_01875 [candidate division Zixibacteria bacterium]
MEKHIKVIGVLYIVFGAMSFLICFSIFVFMAGIGVVAGDYEAQGILTFIGSFMLMLGVITGIPSIIGGWGLLYRKSWARILVIVLSVLHIFDPPLGTALGIYALVILFKDEAQPMFA